MAVTIADVMVEAEVGGLTADENDLYARSNALAWVEAWETAVDQPSVRLFIEVARLLQVEIELRGRSVKLWPSRASVSSQLASLPYTNEKPMLALWGVSQLGVYLSRGHRQLRGNRALLILEM